MEAVEGGDPDQKEADHSEEEDVREVVGPVTRKKNQEPAKQKVLDWQMDLEDVDHIAITLDAMNTYSPYEQFIQIQKWSDTGIKREGDSGLCPLP
jgi:hypothetical protein